MRILNLYAGIGGNRKLWGADHEITAVENDPTIARIYRDFFPRDTVIITDAHQYLLDHFMEFDFIWSSPPCSSHSKVRKELAVRWGQNRPIYPDLRLYEEILFLQHYFTGIYVVENVVSFYKPLIQPQEINKHFFWANFSISPIKKQKRGHYWSIKDLQKNKGFNLKKYRKINKQKLLRNCVEPLTGLHILNESLKNHINEVVPASIRCV
jgi:DNA (cytosine-5)-methyltransferase 1